MVNGIEQYEFQSSLIAQTLQDKKILVSYLLVNSLYALKNRHKLVAINATLSIYFQIHVINNFLFT